jgi:hypothetical protein
MPMLTKTILKSLALCLTLMTVSQAAVVTPNPKSLLKNKRVLIVEGTDWNGGSHATAKAAGIVVLNQIKTEVGITSFTIENSVQNFTLATLNNYDIMVFNNVFNTQLAVGKPFEAAFRAWLAQGNKGWVGYHTSGANDTREWEWYRDSVTAMRYHVHSLGAQSGKMTKTTDQSILSKAIVAGLDNEFVTTDEWYDFELPPNGTAAAKWPNARVIYYLDENSLANKPAPSRSMNPHPMAWYRDDTVKTATAPNNINHFFFASYGHSELGVKSDFFHSSILRAMEYAAGYSDSGVSINISGNPIQTWKGVSFITQSKLLSVSENGVYTLSILSANGKVLTNYNGNGPKTFAPVAFKKAGIYFVKFKSKSKSFSQRVMVY